MQAMADLDAHWFSTWEALGAAPGDTNALRALFAEICAAYNEAPRHYHTLQHLTECLSLLDRSRGLAQHPQEVAIALWFHDAVYQMTAHDNEARSANWASSALRQFGIDATVADRVHALIMATRHQHLPSTPDEKLLVDIDLAILGAEPARFAQYDRQIRAEYQHVPEALYNVKRREVLQGFLQRPQIFCTDFFRDTYEALARGNLSRSVGLGHHTLDTTQP